MRPLSHQWCTRAIHRRQHTTENKHYLHTSLSLRPRRVGAISLHLSGRPALADAARQSSALAEAGQRRWSAPSLPTQQQRVANLAGGPSGRICRHRSARGQPAAPAESSQAARPPPPRHIHGPAGCHYKNTCSESDRQAQVRLIHVGMPGQLGESAKRQSRPHAKPHTAFAWHEVANLTTEIV